MERLKRCETVFGALFSCSIRSTTPVAAWRTETVNRTKKRSLARFSAGERGRAWGRMERLERCETVFGALFTCSIRSTTPVAMWRTEMVNGLEKRSSASMGNSGRTQVIIPIWPARPEQRSAKKPSVPSPLPHAVSPLPPGLRHSHIFFTNQLIENKQFFRHPREGGDPKFARRTLWISLDSRLRGNDGGKFFFFQWVAQAKDV
jgi:hypothetical protein